MDLQNNLIYLEAHHTKAGKRRSVSLNAVACAVILSRVRYRAEHWPASRWVLCDPDRERVTEFQYGLPTGEPGGFQVPRPQPHLRRLAGAGGVPLPEVRDVLGHGSVKMTKRPASIWHRKIPRRISFYWTAVGHDLVTLKKKRG